MTGIKNTRLSETDGVTVFHCLIKERKKKLEKVLDSSNMHE